MYPQRPFPDNECLHRQYIISHKSYNPGERKVHYDPDWKAPEPEFVDPISHVSTGVKDALYWEENRAS